MPLPHRLYAVVSNFPPPEQPPFAKRPLALLQREKLAALKEKKAVDRVNAIRDRLDERMAACQRQITEWERRMKCAADRKRNLEDRAVHEMEARGLTRIDGFGTALSLQPSPPSVDVFDESLLPAGYWRQPKTPAKPDKVAIKAALTANQKVPGARLTQGMTLKRS